MRNNWLVYSLIGNELTVVAGWERYNPAGLGVGTRSSWSSFLSCFVIFSYLVITGGFRILCSRLVSLLTPRVGLTGGFQLHPHSLPRRDPRSWDARWSTLYLANFLHLSRRRVPSLLKPSCTAHVLHALLGDYMVDLATGYILVSWHCLTEHPRLLLRGILTSCTVKEMGSPKRTF